jgi:hypothetical protein
MRREQRKRSSVWNLLQERAFGEVFGRSDSRRGRSRQWEGNYIDYGSGMVAVHYSDDVYRATTALDIYERQTRGS